MTQKSARNLFWNTHIGTNYEKNWSLFLIKIIKKEKNLKYYVFTPEKGEKQNNSFHFQGYFKFNQPIDLKALNKRLAQEWNSLIFEEKEIKNKWLIKDNFFSHYKTKKTTDEDCIDYVKKEGKFKNKENTKIDKSYEETIFLKKETEKKTTIIQEYNKLDPEIPKEKNKQEILIDERIRKNYYKKFTDIRKDFHHIFIKQTSWLKNLWDIQHPIKTLNVKPLEIKWFYGNSGIGKTTLTNKILIERGYKDRDICRKSYEGIDKLWFDLTDEDKKVLWLEEVRRDFPNNNKLIKIIDRKDFLPVKGSQIRNNFELLIVNSLLSPGEIYSNLEEGNQIEVLRRIYLSENSEVIKLTADKKNHNKQIDLTKEMPEILKKHFQK